MQTLQGESIPLTGGGMGLGATKPRSRSQR